MTCLCHFHTVNLPAAGVHERSNVAILVHELVHVYQYERAGSRYFAEALLAQHEAGYDYGGAAALQLSARARGRHLRDFNREQQAQIVQDYYMQRCQRGRHERPSKRSSRSCAWGGCDGDL